MEGQFIYLLNITTSLQQEDKGPLQTEVLILFVDKKQPVRVKTDITGKISDTVFNEPNRGCSALLLEAKILMFALWPVIMKKCDLLGGAFS